MNHYQLITSNETISFSKYFVKFSVCTRNAHTRTVTAKTTNLLAKLGKFERIPIVITLVWHVHWVFELFTYVPMSYFCMWITMMNFNASWTPNLLQLSKWHMRFNNVRWLPQSILVKNVPCGHCTYILYIHNALHIYTIRISASVVVVFLLYVQNYTKKQCNLMVELTYVRSELDYKIGI